MSISYGVLMSGFATANVCEGRYVAMNSGLTKAESQLQNSAQEVGVTPLSCRHLKHPLQAPQTVWWRQDEAELGASSAMLFIQLAATLVIVIYLAASVREPPDCDSD